MRDDALDDDFENEEIIRAKWSIDGASTLAEAAEMSEAFAAHLRAMAAEGWELTHPVNDDHGFCRKKDVRSNG